MTIRTVNTDAACASTFARLDKSPIVAHTEENTLLLNIPRDIEDLDAVTKPKGVLGFFNRMGDRFGF